MKIRVFLETPAGLKFKRLTTEQIVDVARSLDPDLHLEPDDSRDHVLVVPAAHLTRFQHVVEIASKLGPGLRVILADNNKRFEIPRQEPLDPARTRLPSGIRAATRRRIWIIPGDNGQK